MRLAENATALRNGSMSLKLSFRGHTQGCAIPMHLVEYLQGTFRVDIPVYFWTGGEFRTRHQNLSKLLSTKFKKFWHSS